MFFRKAGDGIELFVRLTPRGGGERIDDVVEASDGRHYLSARVRAVPEKGEANAALVALIARAFGLPRRAVTLSAGHTGRLKTLRISGEPDVLATKARQLAPQAIGGCGERR
ncbi:MAG: DUF167 domain-containing protein [Rhizobiaceae bacterium]|nr:DUF167 domain-containing protein [Rhizobiaceae bacterium]